MASSSPRSPANDRFLYFPASRWAMTLANLGLEAEDVFLSPEPEVQLHAWFFLRPESLATLLFCHGNAGNVSHRLENVARLVRTGFQVFLFDYWRYGHYSGRPSEQGFYRGASTAWMHLAGRAETAGAPRIISISWGNRSSPRDGG